MDRSFLHRIIDRLEAHGGADDETRAMRDELGSPDEHVDDGDKGGEPVAVQPQRYVLASDFQALSDRVGRLEAAQAQPAAPGVIGLGPIDAEPAAELPTDETSPLPADIHPAGDEANA